MMGRDSSESALEELECFFVVYLVYDLLLLSPLTVFLLLFFWFEEVLLVRRKQFKFTRLDKDSSISQNITNF